MEVSLTENISRSLLMTCGLYDDVFDDYGVYYYPQNKNTRQEIGDVNNNLDDQNHEHEFYFNHRKPHDVSKYDWSDDFVSYNGYEPDQDALLSCNSGNRVDYVQNNLAKNTGHSRSEYRQKMASLKLNISKKKRYCGSFFVDDQNPVHHKLQKIFNIKSNGNVNVSQREITQIGWDSYKVAFCEEMCNRKNCGPKSYYLLDNKDVDGYGDGYSQMEHNGTLLHDAYNNYINCTPEIDRNGNMCISMVNSSGQSYNIPAENTNNNISGIQSVYQNEVGTTPFKTKKSGSLSKRVKRKNSKRSCAAMINKENNTNTTHSALIDHFDGIYGYAYNNTVQNFDVNATGRGDNFIASTSPSDVNKLNIPTQAMNQFVNIANVQESQMPMKPVQKCRYEDNKLTIKNGRVYKQKRRLSAKKCAPTTMDTERDKTSNKKRPHFCLTCGTSFSSAKLLEAHVDVVSVSSVCPYCGQLFLLACGLDKHMRYDMCRMI